MSPGGLFRVIRETQEIFDFADVRSRQQKKAISNRNKMNEPRRIRTPDLPVTSQLFFQKVGPKPAALSRLSHGPMNVKLESKNLFIKISHINYNRDNRFEPLLWCRRNSSIWSILVRISLSISSEISSSKILACLPPRR